MIVIITCQREHCWLAAGLWDCERDRADNGTVLLVVCQIRFKIVDVTI